MTRHRLTAVITLAVAVGLGACASDDVGDRPDGSDEASSTPTGALATTFDAVRVRVIDPDGIECALCLWRADTERERERGLMQVSDLEGAAGMLFVFDAPTSLGFWMKDTLLPLDVAYFDATGAFLAADSMEPCPAGTTDCPIHRGAAGYTWAIEVPAGEASVYGMEPGGRIALDAPCDPGRTSDTGSDTGSDT